MAQPLPPIPEDPSATWKDLTNYMGHLFEDDTARIKTWMQSQLFKPYFKIWYRNCYLKHFRDENGKAVPKKGVSYPTTTQIRAQLQLTEGVGDPLYTAKYKETDWAAWTPLHGYCWFVAQVTEMNEKSRSGCFFGRTTDNSVKWNMICYALKRCSHDQSRSGSAQKVISREYLEEAGDDPPETPEEAQANIELVEGVTMVWRNRNDIVHGEPVDAGFQESLGDWLFNVQKPWDYESAADLRNLFRDKLDFRKLDLYIAKCYIIERDEKGRSQMRLFTQARWTGYRKMLPGSRPRVFIIFESTKDREFDDPYGSEPLPRVEREEEGSLDDYPMDMETQYYSKESAEDFEWQRFETKNLHLSLKQSDKYLEMQDEFNRGQRSILDPTVFRIDTYNMLYTLSVETTGEVLGDVDQTKKHKKFDASQLDNLSLAHGQEMSQLEELAGSGNRDIGMAAGSRIADFKFREPTQEDRLNFERQQKWLDNPKFQPQDEEAAAKVLNMEDNKVQGMADTFTPYFWQPVAAAATYQFMFEGPGFAFLLDSMGLGKTPTILMTIIARVWKRKLAGALRARYREYGRPRPHLIIVPGYLIFQWAREILTHVDNASVKIYYSVSSRAVQLPGLEYLNEKEDLLSQDSHIFRPHESMETLFVITTPRFFADRHGPSALLRWRVDNDKFPRTREGKLELDDAWRVYDPEWPQGLAGRFGTTTADECIFLKGGLDVQIGIAIRWLLSTIPPIDITTTFIPTFLAMLSGTPIPNGQRDLNYVEIIEDDKAFTDDGLQLLNNNRPGLPPVTRDTNPFELPNNDPAVSLRLTKHAVHKWIQRNGDPVQQGRYIEKFFELCAVKRGHVSKVNGQSISSKLPAKLHQTHKLKLTDNEYLLHRRQHNDLIGRIMRFVGGKRGKRRVIFDSRLFRRLGLLTTATKLCHIPNSLLDSIATYQVAADNGSFTLLDLAEMIHAAAGGSLEEPPEDTYGLLNWFVDGSPKLRVFLLLLAEVVVKSLEKLIGYCGGPSQQLFWFLVLKWINIPAKSLYASLSISERAEIVSNFTARRGGPSVLISTYASGGKGLNLQEGGRARNMIKFDPPKSDDEGFQADGRIFRLGQKQGVRIWDLVLLESFDTWKVANNSAKALCQIMAWMDPEGIEKCPKGVDEGGDDDDDESGEDDFQGVKGQGLKNVLRIGNNFVRNAETEAPLELGELLKHMRDALNGGAESQDWTKKAALLPLPARGDVQMGGMD